MKETEEEQQKPGPAWRTVAIFSEYSKASKRKEELRESYVVDEVQMQLKIKRVGDAGRQFAVKERIDPSSLPEKKKKKKNK
jgi:hypothetical protein